MAAQQFQELGLHQGHALYQRAAFAGLLRCFRGALQVVEHGQQVEEELAVHEAPLLLALALVALLKVLEVGPRTLEQIEELVAFGGFCLELFRVGQAPFRSRTVSRLALRFRLGSIGRGRPRFSGALWLTHNGFSSWVPTAGAAGPAVKAKGGKS